MGIKHYTRTYLKIILGVIILWLLTFNLTFAATLSGKIANQTTNQPLSGAMILLESTDFSATTDENGDYLIENIPDGIYTIIVGSIHYKQRVYRHFGIGIYAGLDDNKKPQSPSEYHLNQNYPNPFNPETTISYGLPKPSHVTLQVYDSIGRHVITLIDAHQSAGTHSVLWKAMNNQDQRVASGIYYLRIIAGQWQQILKMTLIE